jgi:two-component system chemotaxis sensor kinase CheA
LSNVENDILLKGKNHGHVVYEIELSMNRDLNKDSQGPVKLLKKIQAVGMLINVLIDHSKITSLDDILDIENDTGIDIYMKLIVTSVLEKDLFSEAIDLEIDRISKIKMEYSDDNKNEEKIDVENKEISVNNIKEIIDIDKKTEKIEKDSKITEQIKNTNIKKNFKHEDSIRVNVTVLNDLLNMASEMVLGRNQLLRKLEGYRKSISGLSPILQNIDRLTSGMQEKIMQTRMQPVSNVFNKFPRIIRDLSKNIDKEIELQIEGEHVELDKAVIEALADPLTHLVRNSADHGLEKSEERELKGKERAGIIKLKAYHEGGYVNIDIEDDGKGIDIDAVSKKALEKGIITNDELNLMSEQEIIQLIFKAGFSTAQAVSNISGRGVGMDVVRNNIEKLGGSIEIFSKKDIGTTIRLMLPLTLAIIQSLIVDVGGHKFALPQANLKEIVRIKKGDSKRYIEYLHDSEVLRLRGRLLPIFHLADILDIEKTYFDPLDKKEKKDRRNNLTDIRESDSEVEFTPRRKDEENQIIRILVLQVGSKLFGVAVDNIFASEETLVKPLPKYFKSCECYSGVTIMGDGKTAMILDVDGMIKLSSFKFNNEIENHISKTENDDKAVEVQNLLLFKCTGNETYAIDLSMISRVEEIKEDDIEKIGDREYIKYQGGKLRVIYPEDYLPVNRDKHNTKRYVLIPKHVKYPIGVSIEKIIDNINIQIKLNGDDSKINGVVGTTIYENKITLLINLYELFEMAEPEIYKKSNNKIGNAKLLLVEDTPFFQRQEKEFLENAGFDVILASNGKEAYSILEKERFDCIISDIQMPIMDGIEFVKKIKSEDKFNCIPVIALTSMSSDKQKKIGLESGFDFYEIKLDRDNLLTRVNEAVKKNSVREEVGV